MADDPFKDPKKIVIIFVAIIVLSLGVTGNLLVLMAVWKKRWLRSTTNYLLVNLAASDLTTLVSLPFMAISSLVDLEEGTLADFLCKFFISFHVPITAMVASILTLVVLSVERYHAVVKPMKTGIKLRDDTVKYANIGIWATAILLTLPLYILGHYSASSNCRHTNKSNKKFFDVYRLFLATVSIIVPFFIISFCYFQIVRELYFKNKVEPQSVAAEEDARIKRKLVKLSLTVTGAFVLLLVPLAITTVMKLIDNNAYGELHKRAAILVYAESGINPLIYSFQSTNFRKAFKEILRCP